MRLSSFALLATAAFLAIVTNVSAATVSALQLPAAMHSSTDDFITPKRMVRGYDDGDEDRAGMDKVAGLAKESASKLVKASSYFLRNMKVDEVMRKLKFGDDIVATLENPKINTFATYINMLNGMNPKNKLSVVGTLSAHYGDDAVARALVTVQRKNDAATRDLMVNLRKEQINDWLKSKSVDDVFNLLKLRADGYEALTSRKLEVFEEYIKAFNSMTGRQVSLYSALKTGFGGDSELATILQLAKTDVRTKRKAVPLENEMIKHWMSTKLQPEHVLEVLKLNVDATNALKSNNLWTLDKFIRSFNAANSNMKTSLLGTLTKHYGDENMSRALVTAMRDPNTQKTATWLQTKQLKGWWDSEMSIDAVFVKVLKLKENPTLTIASRKLDTLNAYIKFVNSKTSSQTTLLQTLTKHLGDGDLAISLVMGKTVQSTHVKSRAEKLQTAQFEKWYNDGYDNISVLTQIFKLDETELNKATYLQKKVSDEFKAFYARVHHVDTNVTPRRS
uniref:Avh163 n=1 Tax=Phytophthora sojae TaxID=67593 RepID=G1FRR1_PHYSO|nr:Avh163 [Phytophthora sojae]